MPTYRNDSTETRHEYNINDQFVKVAPGDSIETYAFLGDGWTKTVNTPIFNPVVQENTITLTTGGVEVTLASKTVSIGFYDITETVTAVYTEATTITPALMKNLTAVLGYVPVINIAEYRSSIQKIVLTGTGTCRVVQYQA